MSFGLLRVLGHKFLFQPELVGVAVAHSRIVHFARVLIVRTATRTHFVGTATTALQQVATKTASEQQEQ
jgi:hypothetical protein